MKEFPFFSLSSPVGHNDLTLEIALYNYYIGGCFSKASKGRRLRWRQWLSPQMDLVSFFITSPSCSVRSRWRGQEKSVCEWGPRGTKLLLISPEWNAPQNTRAISHPSLCRGASSRLPPANRIITKSSTNQRDGRESAPLGPRRVPSVVENGDNSIHTSKVAAACSLPEFGILFFFYPHSQEHKVPGRFIKSNALNSPSWDTTWLQLFATTA